MKTKKVITTLKDRIGHPLESHLAYKNLDMSQQL